MEKSDNWHLALLRPRSARPGSRGTQKTDELATPHAAPKEGIVST